MSIANKPEPNTSATVYLTIDGDDIGRKITSCYLENDELKLAEISSILTYTVREISSLLQTEGFKLIFSAADGIVGVSTNREIDLTGLFQKVQRLAPDGITFSAGAGRDLKDAYCALTYAKCKGKNNLVDWTLTDMERNHA